MRRDELSCRVELPGVRRAQSRVYFAYTDERATHRIEAAPGETLAAALIAAGHWEMRQSHLHDGFKRAGITCGMGVCSECIVLVDGFRRRACLEPAAEGLRVEQHPARIPLNGASGTERLESTLTPDVLIVGGGPAGLSAAYTAAETGLDVVVVDERKALGGQYFKQPNAGFVIDDEQLDAQFKRGRALIKSARSSSARFLSETSVWGAFKHDAIEIRATSPSQNLTMRPRRLIVATGAYETLVPFQGWDTPGVITTGAAQTLLRGSLMSPGQRVLIAGNGPLNLQVARELANAGANVVAVAEAAEAPHRLASLRAIARMATSSPTLLASGIAHLLSLRSHGVDVMYRYALTLVKRRGRELAATLSLIDNLGNPVEGSEQTFTVDAVCTGYGFQSQTEIARSLGCEHDYDSSRGALAVRRDVYGRTSIPEIFVAGDAGGLGGAQVAMAQGTLAAIAVAGDLGKGQSLPTLDRRARARLNRHRRFQAALWSLYSAPLLQQGQLATASTQVCRCEGLTKRDLLAYAEQGLTLPSIKKRSRAGMGGCQGRYCTPVIAEILRACTGTTPTEADLFAPRPPFRPTPLASLSMKQEV